MAKISPTEKRRNEIRKLEDRKLALEKFVKGLEIALGKDHVSRQQLEKSRRELDMLNQQIKRLSGLGTLGSPAKIPGSRINFGKR
jgi:hypothetical protein